MADVHTPKISVIIPAYNREDYLSATITSCLHQSEPIDEIIVIDNHSTDQTYAIAKKIAQKNSQIKVLRNRKNYGMIENWNRGIRRSTSTYVSLLHSDDLLPYYWCSIVKKAVSTKFKKPPFLYFGTVVCFTESEKKRIQIKSKVRTFTHDKYFKPGEAVSTLWKNFFGNPGCSSALVYRKEVFEKLNYFSPQWGTEADQEFHLRLMQKFPSFYVNEELVLYRIHELQGYDKKKEAGSDSRSIERIVNSLNIQNKLLSKDLINYNYCGVLAYILHFILTGQYQLALKLFSETSANLSWQTLLYFPRFSVSLVSRKFLSRFT